MSLPAHLPVAQCTNGDNFTEQGQEGSNDPAQLGRKGKQSLTPSTTNPLSGSLGAGYQGRTEELLGFPDSALHFLRTAAQQKRDWEEG